MDKLYQDIFLALKDEQIDSPEALKSLLENRGISLVVSPIEPEPKPECLPDDTFDSNSKDTLLNSNEAASKSFPVSEAHSHLEGKALYSSSEFPNSSKFHICSSRVEDPKTGSFHAAFFCRLHHSSKCPCGAPFLSLNAILKLKMYTNTHCYRMSAQHTRATFRKYSVLKKVIEHNEIQGVRVVQFSMATDKDGNHYWLEEMLPGEFKKFTSTGMFAKGRLVTTNNKILQKLQYACLITPQLNDFPIDLQGVEYEGNIILTDIEWTYSVSTLDPELRGEQCKNILKKQANYWKDKKDIKPLKEFDYWSEETEETNETE